MPSAACQPPPETLLFLKPGSLGDVVHALPCAAALRAAWPGVRLTWVIDSRWAPLLEDTPVADELLIFPRDQFRGLGGLLRGAAWLATQRTRRPDLCIDLQGLLRSALIARGAESQRVVGLSDAREGAQYFYHQTADVSGISHAVDRYLRVLPELGLKIPDAPEFPLCHGEPVTGLPDDYILVHPFARGRGKSLLPRQVHALCGLAADQPLVIAGSGRKLGNLPPNAIDLMGETTLGQMLWLIRRARAVVSVDSGPMHIAAAAGVPLLSIHTWSDPRKVGPYSERAWILQGGTIRRQSLTAASLPGTVEIDDFQLQKISSWIADSMSSQQDR